MIGGNRLEYLSGTRPNVLACSVNMKCPVLGAGALVLMLFSASAAQAQCTPVGLNPGPGFPAQPAITAIAGVSAYVGSLVASIHSANTAFLSQSSAFIGSSGQSSAGPAGWRRVGPRHRRPPQLRHNRNSREHKLWRACPRQCRLQYAHGGRFRRRSDRRGRCQAECEWLERARGFDHRLSGVEDARCHSVRP